ncbi:hypothetical protein MMC34_007411 [Xylographa carneopallida]|nr:hypothetical protein [Xylographa carneopallida]
MILQLPIYTLGLLTALHLLHRLATFLHTYVRSSSILAYRHGPASWALITGGSDGLGLGFAQTLCAMGFHAILLGHQPGELTAAQTALQRETPAAQVRILVVDAIADDATALDRALATVEDLHITVLLNNVGGLPPMASSYKPLAAYSAADVDGTIALNARFMARLTRRLLPALSRNGPALIVNLSSGGRIGLPYQVMYAATKAFVAAFSAGLAREVRMLGLPVEVLAITPGNVRTGSHKPPLGWGTPDARTFAAAALGCVGCGRLVVSGYWRHEVQVFVLEALPEWVRQSVLARAMMLKKRTLDKGA